MLQRLVILNSSIYSKAEMLLDDCDSIQLVGPNNIGKSTLIYALNFLFIVDGSRMSFSGNRRGDKETIHHYFPTVNQSYIIFECGKFDPYCIIVKRDIEGELEYYRLNCEFREEYFFEKVDKQQKIRKFEELADIVGKEGLELYQFKSKSEYFNFLYQRGTENNAAVWLEDTVKSDGLNNNFSKVYRYLINSKLITNKSLKDALIIADNRENEKLSFSQKNKKDITDLLRVNDEIKVIRTIQDDFENFREIVNQYNAKTRIVAELIYSFNNNYSVTLPELNHRIIQKEKDIVSLQTEINEELEPKKQTLNQQIGAKSALAETLMKSTLELQKQVDEVKAFETKEFLQESLENLNVTRKEIEVRLTRLESQKISAKQLESKLEKINHDLGRVENQVNNFNNQLIHNLTDKQEDKKLLYTLLSEDFAGQNADLIKKKITKTSNKIQIFDGEIELPKGYELKDLPSLDELKEQLLLLKTDKADTEKLLEAANHLEQTVEQLQNIQKEINDIHEKVRLIDGLPKVEKKLAQQTAELNVLVEERERLERDLIMLTRDIFEKTNALQQSKEEKNRLDARTEELRRQKVQVETFGLDPLENETSESLEVIYQKLILHSEDRETLKYNKDRMFDNLRYKMNSGLADEEQFIKFIEDEIACLEDKEKSIDGLLQSISTQFANPAFNLIRRYNEFKEFVYSKFNQKLSTTRISDIDSLKIELVENRRVMDDLVKISSIQDLRSQLTINFDNGEHRDQLETLNKYLVSGKKIEFDEIFDIELHLMLKGQLKKVDLKNQVESDGTDRMIRLVIVMSIINRLAINADKNKIALFIDEVGTIDEQNRPELVKFCKDHNFIPIFAAPQPYDGFSKYYFIYRNSKGKITVNENQNAVSVDRL